MRMNHIGKSYLWKVIGVNEVEVVEDDVSVLHFAPSVFHGVYGIGRHAAFDDLNLRFRFGFFGL